jgi:flagellar basal body rod protein FlgG
VIEPALAAALARVSDRANDVLQAYASGFEPRSSETRRVAPNLQPSLDPLSASAPRGAYFVVAGQDGPRYTRDGSFHFADGALRDGDGLIVLGYPVGRGTGSMHPLRIDAVDTALHRAHDPQVTPEGVVTVAQTVVDPHTRLRRSERVALGQIALASFPAGTSGQRVDDRHVVPPRGVPVHTGLPGSAGFDRLQTHVRELGQVDVEAGLRRLQEAYLSLSAIQAAFRVHADVDKDAMDLLK